MFRDVHGKPIRMVGTVQDITERRLVEETLRVSTEKLSKLYQLSPLGIALTDMQGRYVEFNEAFRAICGYPADELMTLDYWTLTPKEYEAREGEQLELLSKTGRYGPYEKEYLQKDGARIPIRLNGMLVTGQDKQPYIWSIVEDISEHKRSEERSHEREREFRTLVENLPTYVARLDRDLCYVYANPVYVKALGIPEAELLGMHASESWHASNISVDVYVALLTRVLWNGVQEEVPLEWTDNAGHLCSHIVRVTPEHGLDGQVKGLLLMGFDMSERHQQQRLEAQRQHVFEQMAHGDDLNKILEQVALYVESSSPGRRCGIHLLDEELNRLFNAASPSFAASCMAGLDGVAVCEGERGCATAAFSGERVVVEDICHQACTESCLAFSRETGVAACWSEPILAPSCQVLGVVSIHLNQLGLPDGEDDALLRHAGQLCSIAIERKRIELRMQRQASYDELTGLPNRHMFVDRLKAEIARADRTGGNVALLFIDLDHFKEVNDTLGHEYGDKLLMKASQRIQQCVRESDTVARLGGDEFVAILPDVAEMAHLGRVAQSIVYMMTAPFQLDDHTAFVSASIGIASYPADADSITSFVSAADRAMYVAKERGRNGFSFFTPSMQQKVQQRLTLANDLRDAIMKEQLHIFLQPIVDISSGHIVKAEALIRWKHPQHGMVPPDKFIPIAEEMGLIHDIGNWVFHQAVQAMQGWLKFRTADNGCCQISINMSARQFVHGDVGGAWIKHLDAMHVSARHLVIEITESLLLGDEADIMSKLDRFRDVGMQIALDDFGTGYSAMAYLKKFHIDYLKIDRSFVRDLETDPNDRAIAEAIVVMAHKLGLKTIAEGVETEQQKAMLAEVGCDYVQGYFYARPMPVEEFMAFVQRPVVSG